MAKLRLAWFSEFTAKGWDEPGHAVGQDWRDASFYLDSARHLEQGQFDLIVGADSYALYDDGGSLDVWVRSGDRVGYMHPIPVMAQMATVTTHLGFVPTMSTFAYPPYLLARELATLDHLSQGRAGWNIVTSIGDNTAQNFNETKLPPRDERYARASEFVEICERLWGSWDPDAIKMDLATGLFADPAKVHTIDFVGKWFKVRGPLTISAGPQGRPLYLQAGASPTGMDFAARHADAVIANPSSIDAMREICAGIRERLKIFGRDQRSVKIIFGMKPIIGATMAEAVARRQRLLDYIATTHVETGLANLSLKSGLDLSKYALDEPLQEDAILAAEASAGIFYQHYAKTGVGPTIRQLIAGEGTKESYPLVGTPESIADTIEGLVEEVGFDGLAIREALSPMRVHEVVNLLVPELRKRGLVRSHFRHKTLRDNFFDDDA